MQADFSVELGRDDETLEIPWSSPDAEPRYYDLKRHPECLRFVEEATRVPELAEFLAAANALTSIWETAKCDCWATTEINPEEEIFGAPWKFGSYADLVLTNAPSRFSFTEHESLLKTLIKSLQEGPEIRASAEFFLRRCFFHDSDGGREGLYITFYLFGFGTDETEGRQQWAIALKLVGNALTMLSAQASATS